MGRFRKVTDSTASSPRVLMRGRGYRPFDELREVEQAEVKQGGSDNPENFWWVRNYRTDKWEREVAPAARWVGVQRQVTVPVRYKNASLDCDYRVDLVVNDRVVVELKAVETVHPIHEAQLMTYLRLSGKRVGLLINFNVRLLKDGITRRVM